MSFRVGLCAMFVLAICVCRALSQDAQTPSESRAPRHSASTMEYGLGADPVAERYLTSLDYQDLRLLKKKEAALQPVKIRRTQINIAELNIPEKAQKEVAEARRLRLKSRPEEALLHLSKAIEICPRFARAYVLMSTIYRETGRLEEAEQTLVRAVTVDPESLAARKNLGYLYLATGRPELAGAQLAEASKLEPTDAGARAFLGEAQFKTGRIDEAETSLLRALELDPTCYPAAYRMSAVYAGRGKFPEAVAMLELVLGQEHPGLETANLQVLLERLRGLADSSTR
jgi:Flp pilus assembly protein TadD